MSPRRSTLSPAPGSDVTRLMTAPSPPARPLVHRSFLGPTSTVTAGTAVAAQLDCPVPGRSLSGLAPRPTSSHNVARAIAPTATATKHLASVASPPLVPATFAAPFLAVPQAKSSLDTSAPWGCAGVAPAGVSPK